MTHKSNTESTQHMLPLILVLCTVWLFACSDIAEKAAMHAMKTCASVIIPSLFPFMVISSMLVRSGTANSIGRWLAQPVRYLFRLPGCTGGALILGALCGFPVGAKIACELYENGFLTKNECERLIAIANNTGPSFVIEVVGAHFWHSRGMGIAIYVSQLLSAALIGWLASRREQARKVNVPSITARSGFLQCLASSITQSARSVLSICGFIAFFAVITSVLRQLLHDWNMDSLSGAVAAVIEFSTGASTAAEIGGAGGAFLTGLAVGWSGISVFAQCTLFTAPYNISLRTAAISKAVQGILTGLAAAAYYTLRYVPSTAVSTPFPFTDVSLSQILIALLILAVASIQFQRRNS